MDRLRTKTALPDENRTCAGAAALVEQRLHDILKAARGRDVRTNGDELSFVAECANGLEVRLAAAFHSPCYERSANFAISYGGGPSDQPPPPAFCDLIETIKALDDSPIVNVAALFQTAAAQTASRFADCRAHDSGGSAGPMPDSRSGDTATNTSGEPGREGRDRHSDVHWERLATRRLNVVFLDLCASLIGKMDEPLSPLHWGFWPADIARAVPGGDDYDPFEAFSENLLAHIPPSVTRIMDVGCGLGANARRLASRRKRVTAVSPVARHCAIIEAARLPGVDVRCARFEELSPDDRYDLLLFSESLNHFALGEKFFDHCKQFLVRSGFLLMADDLTEERASQIAGQRVFRVLRSVDISGNVAPTNEWWARHLRAFSAYRAALLSILEMYDAPTAVRVHDILGQLDSPELKLLFSGEVSPPRSKGRYMIYLLQLV